MKKKIRIFMSILLLGAILQPVSQVVVGSFTLNLLAVHTLHATLPGSNFLMPVSNLSLVPHSCKAAWFQGFLAWSRDDEIAQEAAWMSAIRCDPRYIVFLHKMLPKAAHLAELSVQEHPEVADGWLWLADTITSHTKLGYAYPTEEIDREQAITYYRKGLSLSPGDGLRWCDLGDLLQKNEPVAAIEAYLQSCSNGDPGYHGCQRAAQTAERIGDIENAILYYRYSKSPGVFHRADELEAQLNSQE